MKSETVKVKLVAGLLSADIGLLAQARKTLQKYFGPSDAASPVIPFNFSSYYDKELGSGIQRQFVSFSRLIKPAHTADIKLLTMRIEKKFTVKGNRKVNIDPGYIVLDKLVVSTSKDATYRIYLGKGIYAQSMLFFMDGGFKAWEWTYPDYKSEMAITFFNRVRKDYKDARK